MTTKLNKELSALVSLLDEPNEDIYLSIRTKIASYGPDAIPLLEDAWLNVTDGDFSKRIEDLIDEIRLDDLFFELLNWSNFYNNDLFKAFLIVSKFRYPELDETKYTQKFERLVKDTWLEINDHLTALEKVKVLNHIFYDIHQFRGIRQPMSLNAFFLNEVMDSQRGNAITLGMIYIALSQRLRIPIFGVDLSRHFIMVYMDDTFEIREADRYSENDVLFYINSLNKGAVFTKNEINQFISQANLKSKNEYFLPCDSKIIIRRYIEEMSLSYQQDNQLKKADSLISLIKAID